MADIKIEFLGTMGSIPVGDSSACMRGGDTSCVAVRYEDVLFFLDGGSGIRKAGRFKREAGNSRQPIRIMLSHVHLDHYMGIPFCPLIYDKNLKFEIVGPDNESGTFADTIDRILRPPYFPVAISELGNIRLESIAVGKSSFFNIEIDAHPINHPDGGLAWRLKFPNGKNFVYVSDNEMSQDKGVHEKLVSWMKGADLLIHDAQYTPAEYKKHIGWGHSPYTYSMRLAKEGNVKRLLLFHHNPLRGESEWNEYVKESTSYAKAQGVDSTIAVGDMSVTL